jgi:hypothetical protein
MIHISSHKFMQLIYCSQTLKLFGFPISRFWAYLMKVIPEIRRVCYIWYLHVRFYGRLEKPKYTVISRNTLVKAEIHLENAEIHLRNKVPMNKPYEIWIFAMVFSILCPPPTFVGRHCFCPVRLFVKQIVSATLLKLLNIISWNLVDSKDTICSYAYYQEILIARILWELCSFELRNFPKFTTEAACQRNSSETTKQNFMKLGR